MIIIHFSINIQNVLKNHNLEQIKLFKLAIMNFISFNFVYLLLKFFPYFL